MSQQRTAQIQLPDHPRMHCLFQMLRNDLPQNQLFREVLRANDNGRAP